MKFSSLTATMLLLICVSSSRTAGEVIDRSGMFEGFRVDYKVVLPLNYDSSRPYPGVLAFAGGSQSLGGVAGMIERNWRAEAERRGYIVVSPAAPAGQLFFERGDLIFPAFLNQIMRDYRIEGGKFHVAGPSYGGISAFHMAGLLPHLFRSVTGFPGYLLEAPWIRNLKSMCIYMHVGEHDQEWASLMRPQVEIFRQNGLRVEFTIEKDQPHGIATLAGEGARRLFDEFEEARKICN